MAGQCLNNKMAADKVNLPTVGQDGEESNKQATNNAGNNNGNVRATQSTLTTGQSSCVGRTCMKHRVQGLNRMSWLCL